MAQSRDHLPKILQNTAAKKAWSKKILKHYVVKRLPLWNSTKGTINKIGKFVATFVSFGKFGSLKTGEEILKDCNSIKTDIEAASEYAHYIKLIKKLHEMAVEAKDEQVPGASNPSLRTDTYYAIIAMLHEIIKSDFADDYQRDINRITDNLNKAQTAFSTYYTGGRSREQIYEDINDALRELVLLGHRPIYETAFEFHRNLFPKLFRPISGKFSFIEEEAALKYKGVIEVQLEQEQGIKANLEGLARPNINIPYQLQPDFPIIFCFYELKKSLGFCTKFALDEDIFENGLSYHELFKFEKDKFIAANQVDTKLLHEDVSQDAQVNFLPVDSGEIAFLPPSPETQVEYEIEVEDDGLSESPTEPASQQGEAVVNSNIIPLAPQAAPASPQPKISALGTFGNTAAAAQSVAEELSAAATDEAETEEVSGEMTANAEESLSAAQPKSAPNRRARRRGR